MARNQQDKYFLILIFVIELKETRPHFLIITYEFLPVLVQFHTLFSLEQAGDEALDNQWQF
jgi:hypothetical protein